MAVLCPILFSLGSILVRVVHIKYGIPSTAFKSLTNTSTGVLLVLYSLIFAKSYPFDVKFWAGVTGAATMVAGFAISYALTKGYAGVV